MSQEQRFTAWLSDVEREKLEEAAAELGTTKNFIVRTALRAWLGLPAAYQSRPDVTVVTGHKS